MIYVSLGLFLKNVVNLQLILKRLMALKVNVRVSQEKEILKSVTDDFCCRRDEMYKERKISLLKIYLYTDSSDFTSREH